VPSDAGETACKSRLAKPPRNAQTRVNTDGFQDMIGAGNKDEPRSGVGARRLLGIAQWDR